ncbi:MAG: STAS domain-containing protein [Gammaproteobacteria bacterium]
MSLTISEVDESTIKIQTAEKFTFECHREMRAAYEGRSVTTKYIIDFSRTDYIDSSALGMLLLLREASGDEAHKVKFINCKASVKKVFDVANFGKMFDIT